ncbi:Ig-like domain-containing protein, partial [Halomonas sp. V046]|uniref:Ig-like domain-containing protein n=1 Tax=Halomonas sp. V046 TaxID=3459611 RepID=UPI004044F8E8
DDGTFSVVLDEPQLDGEALGVTQTDTSDNESAPANATAPDATAPAVGLEPITTNDATPELTGTVDDPDATITIRADGVDYDATNNGDGTWTLADDTLEPLVEGANNVTITATDPANNVTSIDAVVNVDLTGPADGDGLNSVAFEDGGDNQLSAAEATSVTLSGVIEVGSSIDSITISDGSTPLAVNSADITVGPDGAVTVVGQDLSGLVDGELTVTTTVTDAAGNTGTITDTTTLDATAPTVALDSAITNDTRPALSGTVDDPGATIVVTVDDVDYDATNNGDGTWTLADDAVPALGEGDTTITVLATDAAGNSRTVTGVIVIDTVPPATDDGFNSISFNDGNGVIDGTEAGSVSLTGKVEAGSSVDSIVISDSDDGTADIALDPADITIGADGTVTVGEQDLGSLTDGPITVTMGVTDEAGNSGSVSDTTTLNAVADDPIAVSAGSSLLGLVGLEALGVIDLNDQDLAAYDQDGDLRQVVVTNRALLGVSLSAIGLDYSQALAGELGLSVVPGSDSGGLGLLGPRSWLTITATDEGDIDNLAINEFLATVHYADSAIDLSLLGSTTVEVEDSRGAGDSDSSGNLLGLSLLSLDNTPDYIQEGTTGDDTLIGDAGHDRIYGYDGNDTLIGGGGSDILRGGAGDDFIQIGDDGFAMVDGGDGFDTLELDGGFDLDVTQVQGELRNLESIDLGDGDGGSMLTLDESEIIELTDSDNELQITGDEADTLNVSGAVSTGNQQTIDGSVYAEYQIGDTAFMVDDSIKVEVS